MFLTGAGLNALWIRLRDEIAHFGRAVSFFGDILRCILRGRIRWGEVFKQLYDQGVQSLLIVVLCSLASGVVLAMQMQVMMVRFGAEEFIAQVVGLALVRELSPVFTALIFSGKAGAGIASELASMSVNNQIQATRTLGVDPIEFLIVPRMIACCIAVPLLTVISEVVGIWGGYLITVMQINIPGAYYLNQTVTAIGYVDFFSGILKACAFGVLVGWTCCVQGFFTTGGSLGVGRFTTRAVALCYVAVIVSNVVLTKLILTFWG